MEFIIQPMTIDRYEEVSRIWAESDGISLSDTDARENIQSFLKRNEGLSFIALLDDKIVGLALCGHDGRRGYIHHLAVHRNYRHRGIGRVLVNQCLDAIRMRGIEKCHIFVYSNNSEAISFWEKIGWEERVELIVMSRTIRCDNN
jgi:ribosomal protein S18 acetylase RimI-like enzyme